MLLLLKDALAFRALGNLPGALAADLTMESQQTSFAAAPAVQSRSSSSRSSSSSSSSCVDLHDGVPCSLGDTLANSAHQVDGDQLSRDTHWQCRLHSQFSNCVTRGSPHRNQLRIHYTRSLHVINSRTEDGHVWVQQYFLHPIVRHCFHDRSREDFLFSRLRISP